jgi:hypothetical protein
MAKDAKGHGSEKGGGGMPLQGHPFHTKTNDELRFIAKDANAAANATRGMSLYDPNSHFRQDTEGKYLDQVNDASTVLGYRARGGADLSQSPAVGVAAAHGIDTSHLAERFPAAHYDSNFKPRAGWAKG